MVAYIKIISGELKGARGYICDYEYGNLRCVLYKPGELEPVKKTIIPNQFEVIESYFKQKG